MEQSIGNFLLRQIHEAGIRHMFGVTGDYNPEFMQQLKDRGDPAWIGTCNELNGAYAADGYGRIHGLAALTVTYGVGSLTAMNAVAGAYGEHVPVISIADRFRCDPANAARGCTILWPTAAPASSTGPSRR